MSEVLGRPSVLLLYHFFHPDDVVSARHFSDLALGLTRRGWDVAARPCNRACRDASRYPFREDWAGGRIRRVWRPAWSQSRFRGRAANTAWMLMSWGLDGFAHRPDAVVIGTDPVMGYAASVAWRVIRPGVPVVQWAFDLYPEAAVADGMMNDNAWPVKICRSVAGPAYRACRLIADIGPCMRGRIDRYRPTARRVTLTPWALAEPPEPIRPDPAVRRELFGDARLGLLYSGSFGRAHGYREFLELARMLRDSDIQWCFAGRGNRMDELKKSVGPDDTNVGFAGFAPEADLEARLGAADIHLVSLNTDWTGVVVPSKFFGSLAAGRPVVFAGSPDSAIARWISEHHVGWSLTPNNITAIAGELKQLAAAPDRLAELQKHCHAVYARHFAREPILDAWDRELRAVLPRRRR